MIKTWKIIKSILYFILFIFSTGYFLTCLIYAGIAVSWLFIWPMLAIFCLVRFIMLRCEIKGRTKWRSPLFFRVVYRICFITVLCIFVYVESLVIGGMHTSRIRICRILSCLVQGLGAVRDETTFTAHAGSSRVSGDQSGYDRSCFRRTGGRRGYERGAVYL